jgi:eukaryotic-like serine/threonine-protein kinase
MTDLDVVVAGRYRVVRSLGVGGMGKVWLARDQVLGRDVAIKEVALPWGLSQDEHDEVRRRTLREARAAARLSHPSVVKVYNVESDEERQWIVMEYVRSRSLLQVLRENGALPVDEVAGIGLAILSALGAANRVGVLHRDVKPSNVLIADDGRVVLTDFGSALLDENAGAITRTGVIVGTPQYIAPERARTGLSTPESDLWSLGATLYHAVEGRAPYTRTTTMETLIALANEKPDRMARAGPLKPVIGGLLHKDPRARMRPAEAEHRLWHLAAVRPTVRLDVAPGALPASGHGENGAAAPDEAGSRSQALAYRPRRYWPARWQPRRWQWLAAAAMAGVLLAATMVALGADGEGGSSTREAVGGAPSASAQGWFGGTAPPGAADQNEIPAGYRWWYDPTGMRVAFPAGWEPLREGSEAMLFYAPGDPRTLRVRVWKQAGPDLAAALAGEEKRAPEPGYRRIGIRPLPQGDGAEREYVFDGPTGPMRGLERAFTIAGQTYLLQWRTPLDAWQANLPNLTVITQSFRPPGG